MSEFSAEEITRGSKSNLAFALRCLPKERRTDMVTFYAFCRIVDDLADEQFEILSTAPQSQRHLMSSLALASEALILWASALPRW